MDLATLQRYLIPTAVVGFILWRIFRFALIRKQLPSLLSDGAVIIDVRSAAEYASGASKQSINIPLDELERRADKLSSEKPIILCCASGTRSGIAAGILKRKGFKKVLNAGPWRNTNP